MQFTIVDLEDIVVFSKSLTDRFQRVRRVMRLFHDAEGKLKVTRCKLFVETIDDLGHVIRPDCRELRDHTTNTVTKLAYLTTQTRLCSFLGLCNLLRRFFANFARPAALLNKTLRKVHQRQLGPLG